MHRVRMAKEDVASGHARLAGAPLHHVRDVLRLGRGDRVEIFDGEGGACVTEIVSIGASAADLVRVAATPPRAESPLSLTLAVATSRAAKLDWVVEKATELGVSRIVPFMTERTVHAREATAARLARWRKIVDRAAAQSGRSVCPQVDEVVGLDAVLALARTNDRALFFWEGGGEPFGATSGPRPGSVLVAIGAEGGFSAAEAESARRGGMTIVSLGPRTLRAETAAIAAVSLVQHAWGDLGPVASTGPSC